jgi:hypothetical protein
MNNRRELWKGLYDQIITNLYGDEAVSNTDKWTSLDFMEAIEGLVSYEIKDEAYTNHMNKSADENEFYSRFG